MCANSVNPYRIPGYQGYPANQPLKKIENKSSRHICYVKKQRQKMSVIVNGKGGEKGGLCSQHVHRLDPTKHDERKKAFLQCGWKRF